MGVPSDRTAVVYPAVDYDFWNPVGRHSAALRSDLGLSENAFVYLYFGRPGISKGIEYLLDAAVLVRARLPESRLVLVLARDPAKHHKQLMQRVSLNGLEDHVTVMDPVPRSELPGLLLAADCVCVPSISEGFGYSAVEANALGCVVVATTGHSVEEVIPGGAVFVPPGDSAALAEGLLKVAAGEAPPEIQAQIYDVASHLRGIEAVYRSVTLS
jgi:glycosyltransferase involved in cell wall biosynthesis